MRILSSAALPVALSLLVSLCGCVNVPPLPPSATAPQFDAMAFFSGHSEGTGCMSKLFSKPAATRVHSVGIIEGQTLILDQSLASASGPPTHRQWRIHATGPGRYAGTLSNAPGDIVGEVSGNRLHFSFKTKDGLTVQQWLTLAPDRRSARNVMTVTKLGLRLAVLTEDIRKTD